MTDYRSLSREELIAQIKNLIKKLDNIEARKSSSFENEAQVAATMAEKVAGQIQALMQEYALTEADLRAGDMPEVVLVRVELPRQDKWGWMTSLGHVVGEAFSCRTLQVRQSQYTPAYLLVIGLPTDVEVAVYTFESLLFKFKALGEEYRKTYTIRMRKSLKAMGFTGNAADPYYLPVPDDSNSVRYSFLLGCVRGVKAVFQAQKEVFEASGGAAIVLVKGAKIQEFVEQEFPKMRNARSSRAQINGDAYHAGIQAGRRAEVNKGLPGNTREAKGLKAAPLLNGE